MFMPAITPLTRHTYAPCRRRTATSTRARRTGQKEGSHTDKQDYAAKISWLRGYRESLSRERILTIRLFEEQKRIADVERSPLTSDLQLPQLLEERQRKIINQVQDGFRLRVEIEESLKRLPNQMQRLVLEARYIDGLEWWKIANTLHISERWARQIHKKAIENLKSVPSSSAFSN